MNWKWKAKVLARTLTGDDNEVGGHEGTQSMKGTLCS